MSPPLIPRISHPQDLQLLPGISEDGKTEYFAKKNISNCLVSVPHEVFVIATHALPSTCSCTTYSTLNY